MATAEVSKSEEVRKYIKANRKAKPKDVAAALKEQGIDVTPAAVSNIKFQMQKKRAARRAKKAAANKAPAAKEAAAAGNGVSKAQAIRDTFVALGLDARPKDVVDVLAGRSITVSSAQVIGVRNRLLEKRSVRKLKLKRRRKVKASGRKAADSLSLATLLATKAAVEKAGGVEAVRQALAALEKLSG